MNLLNQIPNKQYHDQRGRLNVELNVGEFYEDFCLQFSPSTDTERNQVLKMEGGSTVSYQDVEECRRADSILGDLKQVKVNIF